ncbi:moxd2 [Symbiodinium natans]|uniref:Moxd2 protein n=1 Tax=Symbiodinium natans TaxID=878477 RepID=A0A812R7M3_9DINO|nr:moxd2 [Symbiodinium natans]
MVVVEEDDGGSVAVTDMYSHGFERPIQDKLQNWKLQSISRVWLDHGTDCPSGNGTFITKAVLRRMAKTCDAEDEELGPAWMQNYFVAAYGLDRRMRYHGGLRETTSHYFYLPEPILASAAQGVAVDLLSPTLQVPAGQTNLCYIKVQVPCRMRVHAWQVLNVTNLHHMHLGPLEPELDFAEAYQCSSYSPGAVSLSWGLGDSKKVLPNSLFIELEAGTYVLEAHFENFRHEAFEIQTGFRLWVSEETWGQAEQAIEISRLDGRWQDLLPAGHFVEKSFVLPVPCTSQIPLHGVTVVGALAHMHYAGASFRAYRTRGGRTDLIFEQRGYDFNRQAVIYKPFKLLRGDVISWTCTFDLRRFQTSKSWGLTSEDEMCELFLAANPPLPFARAVVGIPAAGREFAVCSKEACFDMEKCSEVAADSPDFYEVAEAPAMEERGPSRELCQLLVDAEAAPPPNNWAWPSSLVLQLAATAVGHTALASWYRRMHRVDSEAEVLKRSLNLLAALVGTGLGVVIASHPEWFLSEHVRVYSVDEAIGSSFWPLSYSADIVGVVYLYELVVRGATNNLRWHLAVHHGATVTIIGLLRNAFAFDHAPQFYAGISASLLLHVVADVPVLLIFALRSGASEAGRKCLNRTLFHAALLKLGMHMSINALSLWLFYVDQGGAFHLARVSFAAWFKQTYNEARPLAIDGALRFDWTMLLQSCLPILIGVLFVTQIWTTVVLWRIASAFREK